MDGEGVAKEMDDLYRRSKRYTAANEEIYTKDIGRWWGRFVRRWRSFAESSSLGFLSRWLRWSGRG